jgi:hypothetical protein
MTSASTSPTFRTIEEFEEHVDQVSLGNRANKGVHAILRRLFVWTKRALTPEEKMLCTDRRAGYTKDDIPVVTITINGQNIFPSKELLAKLFVGVKPKVRYTPSNPQKEEPPKDGNPRICGNLWLQFLRDRKPKTSKKKAQALGEGLPSFVPSEETIAEANEALNESLSRYEAQVEEAKKIGTYAELRVFPRGLGIRQENLCPVPNTIDLNLIKSALAHIPSKTQKKRPPKKKAPASDAPDKKAKVEVEHSKSESQYEMDTKLFTRHVLPLECCRKGCEVVIYIPKVCGANEE